jgi:hypothetical protein
MKAERPNPDMTIPVAEPRCQQKSIPLSTEVEQAPRQDMWLTALSGNVFTMAMEPGVIASLLQSYLPSWPSSHLHA